MKIENEQHKMARNGRSLRATMAVAVMLIAASYVNGDEPGEKKDSSTQPKTGKPLKVFILAGQSNMQQPAKWQTLAGLADSPETRPLYDKLVDETGKVRIHKDVCVAFPPSGDDEEDSRITTPVPGGPLPRGFGGLVLGKDHGDHSFGPELGFAATMYETMQEPILIIKTAWGGKSLCADFRPATDVPWTPPKGHPDHPDSAIKIPIPTSFELPEDFQPPTVPGKNIQIGTGWNIGKVNGVHAIYVTGSREEKGGLTSIPIQKGDLILGLNGQGLGDDPVRQWRDMWFNKVREGDWKLKITCWRPSPEGKGKGTIETFEIDVALTLKDGRAGIPAYLAAKEANQKKLLKGGEHYWMMINLIQTVLKDPGKYHPAYDPDQGYEIAGFVWLQGYNDVIASTVYPSGNKPRGYEQYSWLLAHLIRNVRKELKTPELFFVIGVFGQGGKMDKPDPFREAMAAPASYEEFKGTVAAVETAEFWDARIPEIQGKLKPVRTPEETAYLQNNVSNQGYHYFGSPKFFVRTGAALAEALSGIIRKKTE